MTDAVCLGILVADIFSSPVDAVPAEGELKLAERFLLSAGGCAVNTAACLRRLDKQARVIGKVGQDLFGDFVVGDLQRLGIDPAGVRRSRSQPTSSTFILTVKGQDRRYIHLFGANADFSSDDVDLAMLDGARTLYVGGYLVMPAFRPDQLARLFEEARRRSITTVLDVIIPAGAGPLLAASVEPVLPFTDAFLPNEDEARLLTGESDPGEQAACLARFNEACAIVITRGRHGLLARRNGRVWRAEAPRVSFLDGSGAGDAFAAGFIVGLLEGWPFEETLRFSSVIGASCTQALGCTEGVFHREEALAFLAGNPVCVERII